MFFHRFTLERITTMLPKDYTAEQITAWLDTLRNASDTHAIQLLVERIDVKTKTDLNVTSTLQSVLDKHGSSY